MKAIVHFRLGEQTPAERLARRERCRVQLQLLGWPVGPDWEHEWASYIAGYQTFAQMRQAQVHSSC